MTTDRTRYIPDNATENKREGLDAVVFSYQIGPKLCAIAYHGKATNRDWHIAFRTEEQRANEIKTYFDRMESSAKVKAERKQAQKDYIHDYKPGDILYSSWGYDQTNIDYYEVIAAPTGKTIVIREVMQERSYNQMYQGGQCSPLRGQFIPSAEAMTKRVNAQGYVTLTSYSWAHKWDGTPKSYSDGH